ncbi:hypothetical protein EV421DRAFT_1809188 [Armillaria borealis]|uniref:Uncharacterized protein n=1 Tax=Armillaria borealis TaxID=47425 RepID=A0AA39MQH0_9AGAR|nr:hypothetical protein EV421DRAFT_1809188 [Armillaria borealis]
MPPPRTSIPGSLEGILDLVVLLFAALPTPNISFELESALPVGCHAPDLKFDGYWVAGVLQACRSHYQFREFT